MSESRNKYPKVIVEIPHQRRAIAYLVQDEDHVIDLACVAGTDNCGGGFTWHRWTREEAERIFSDIPKELMDILDEKGVAVETAWYDSGDVLEFMTEDDAPSEFDAALSYILHDLHYGKLLGLDEAWEWSQNYTRHKWVEVRCAMANLLGREISHD